MKRSIRATAVLTTVLLGAGVCLRPALAATLLVPADHSTISAAVTAAADGDTVLVSCGTYAEANLAIFKSLTIRSDPGDPNCVTIDVAGTPLRIFDVHTTVLEGLTFTGGGASMPATTLSGNAGSSGYLRATDCRWEDNSNSAIRLSGNAVLDSCNFRRNGSGSQSNPGSALAVVGTAAKSVSVRNCSFSDNVGQLGGAVATRLIGAALLLDSCTFTNNRATRLGGAVCVTSAARTITNCRFVGNSAVEGGGAVAGRGAQLILKNCVFSGNLTPETGAAVHLEPRFTRPTTLNLQGCSFQANDADFRGGAVFTTEASSASMSDCSFVGNNSDSGGGAYFEGSGTVNVDSCLFRANTAREGGAITTSGPDASVVRSILFRNSAYGEGGGIYAALTNLRITGSSLVENGAQGGAGGVRLFGLGAETGLVLENSVIAFGTSGEAVARGPGGLSPQVSCSDVFANAGGDWTSGISGLDAINNNFSADPMFCNRPAGDLSLASNSPCSAANSPCGRLIGAADVACVLRTALDQRSWGQIKAAYRD